jgi:hypothetical protein
MLAPVRRWALRELKVHPGQVVVAAGYPVPWTIAVLRDLVGDEGAVVVLEGERRSREVEAFVGARGWSNVTVVAAGQRGEVVPGRAERVLLDWGRADAGADVGRVVSLLGPGGRLAAVCRRGTRGCADLGRLPYVRRESFYGGAAYALWGQVP